MIGRAREIMREFLNLNEGEYKKLLTAAETELERVLKYLRSESLTSLVDLTRAEVKVYAEDSGEGFSDKVLSTLKKPPFNGKYVAVNRQGQPVEITIPLPDQHKLNGMERKAMSRGILKDL